jgi:hypothetical protein
MLPIPPEVCLNEAMDKSEAIRLLGGSNTTAAAEVGVTPQAVSQWPDPLPPRIADRVLAALARKKNVVPVKTKPGAFIEKRRPENQGQYIPDCWKRKDDPANLRRNREGPTKE